MPWNFGPDKEGICIVEFLDGDITVLKNEEVLDTELTLRSPEMLAPAKIPVAAGKKMENIEKKLSPSW